MLVRSVVAIETRTKCEVGELERHERRLPSANASYFEDHGLVDMVHVRYAMNLNQHETDPKIWE